MAIMTSGARAIARAAFIQPLCETREVATFTKAQCSAAVDAVDQWASDNAASFNAALPVAFRNAATAAQKARLLMAVVRQRFIAGV